MRGVYSTTVTNREAKVNLQHESGEMDQSRQSAANPPDKGGVARPEASGPSAPTQLDAGVQFREVRAVYSNLQYLKDLCWWRNPGRAMERGRAAPAFDRWP